MDETSQQSAEGDLGLITKDCDGNGSIEDPFDMPADSRIYRKNSNETEVPDTPVAAEINSSSSNGIDSEVKLVVDNFVSYDMKLDSEAVASSTELIKSNTVQSDLQHGSEDDKENYKMNLGAKGASNEENVTSVDGVEQLNCTNLDAMKANDESRDKILPVHDEKIENAFIDVDKSDENIEFSDSNSRCSSALGKDIDDSARSDKMPYEEKYVSSDDIEINDSLIKCENSAVESERNESANFKNEEMQFEGMGKFENDDASAENFQDPKKEENLNYMNDSGEFLTPSDSDSKDNLQLDGNPLMEQQNKADEDLLISKNDTEVMDVSEMKDDGAATDIETINAVMVANSPKSVDMGQSDESQILKTSSQSDKTELVNTEIVNCNDESELELSGNEKDLEMNNIDTDPCEGEDKKEYEQEIEEMDVDRGEDSFEKELAKKTGDDPMKDELVLEEVEPEKEIVSVDESEALVHPGGSEETITGDTNSEGPINNSRGKDAEICIIPDDVTQLSVRSHDKKQSNQKDVEETSKQDKSQRDICLEIENDRDDVKNEDDDSSKLKADGTAKISANKMKSLVQADDGQGTASSKRGAEDDSISEEAVTACAQCGEVGL